MTLVATYAVKYNKFARHCGCQPGVQFGTWSSKSGKSGRSKCGQVAKCRQQDCTTVIGRCVERGTSAAVLLSIFDSESLSSPSRHSFSASPTGAVVDAGNNKSIQDRINDVICRLEYVIQKYCVLPRLLGVVYNLIAYSRMSQCENVWQTVTYVSDTQL